MTDILWFLVLAAFIWIFIVFFLYNLQNRSVREEQLRLEEWLNQAGIQEIDSMDGIEFEKYLEMLFRKKGIQVMRTQSSGDFGADLILEGEERVVIQAKRYAKKVGVRAVQEVNSARDYYKAHEAWVITNNFFTEQAKELAESTNVELLDRYDLVDLINGIFPSEAIGQK